MHGATTGKRPETAIAIREFQPGDEDAFRRLNEEWILRYFVMEPRDEASILHPHSSILEPGGRIFFAVSGGEPVGCSALVPARHAPGEYEVAKMAVTESCQGRGIGRRLLAAVIAAARELGAQRLSLETNSVLEPAIRLYESVGFRHLPPERRVPSDYARSNVSMELDLPRGPEAA